MAETLPNISIGQSWVDVNTESGISVGTAFSLYNEGTGSIKLIEQSSEPSHNDTKGKILDPHRFPNSLAIIPTGSLRIWAKAISTLGAELTPEVIV